MRTQHGTHLRAILTLMLAASGGAAVAQTPPAGMPGGTNGTAGSGANAGTTHAGPEKFFDKKVSVDADSGRLVDVLPKLLKSVDAEFVISPDVKNALVSGHLTGVKFKTALDLLMRVSNIPVEYRYEDGLFRFTKKVEPSPTLPEPLPGEAVLPPPPRQGEERFDVREVGVENLIRALTGGDPSFLPPSPSGYSSGSANGHSSYSSFGFSPNGVHSGSGGNQFNSQGNNTSSQNNGGGGSITIFGHTIHLGGGGNNGHNGSNGGH